MCSPSMDPPLIHILSMCSYFIVVCTYNIGITRMERWNRAEKHGLNPPNEVRDLITLHSQEDSYTKGYIFYTIFIIYFKT